MAVQLGKGFLKKEKHKMIVIQDAEWPLFHR
jgi:hypothetical protein